MILASTSITLAHVADGTDGRSVKSITAYYAKNNSNTTAPTSGWSPSGISPDANNRFLWYKEATVYSDSSTPIYTTPVIIGVYGEKGDTGEKGQSLTATIEQWGSSSSTTEAPTSFEDTKPNITTGLYLWRRLKLEWANPTATTYTTATLVDTTDTQMPYIRGTQTASTNAWTGNAPTIASLYSGLTIRYYLPYAATSNVTLKLTLKDGSDTEAINCYYGTTTRLTSHYGAGSLLTLTYLPAADNKAGVNGWFCTPQYYSYDNSNQRYNTPILAKTAITAYALVGAADSTGYFKIVAGSVISIKYPLLMAGSAISASKTGTNNYIGYYSVNLAYNVSGLSFTQYKPVYIKGVYSKDGTFTVDSTTPFTQTEPTTVDGCHYIRLGIARSGTAVCFEADNKIWTYNDGHFGQLYGDKGDKGDDGKNPVSVILSDYGYNLTAETKNAIDGTKIACTVSVKQTVNGAEKEFSVVSATPTTNGTFQVVATATGITYITVSGSTVKGSSSSAMTATTATIDITVNYMDYDGAKGTEKKTITVSQSIKGDTGKTGAYTLYQYYLSTSETSLVGGEWKDTMPSLANTGKYLWMHSKTVPAGGDASKVNWGNAVVAGTDISSLVTKINTVDGKTETNATLIQQNGDSISAAYESISSLQDVTAKTQSQVDSADATIKTVQQSVVTLSDTLTSQITETKTDVSGISETVGTLVQQSASNVTVQAGKTELYVGQDQLKLKAPAILVEGSVTMKQLAVDDIFSSKIVIQDKDVGLDTEQNGVIRSASYDDNGEKVTEGAGFYLNSAGQFKTKSAIIEGADITEGTIGKATINESCTINCDITNKTLHTVSSATSGALALNNSSASNNVSYTFAAQPKHYYRPLVNTWINKIKVNQNAAYSGSTVSATIRGTTYTKARRYQTISNQNDEIYLCNTAMTLNYTESGQAHTCTYTYTITGPASNTQTWATITYTGKPVGTYSWDDHYETEEVYVPATYSYDWKVTSSKTYTGTAPDGGGTEPSDPSVGDTYTEYSQITDKKYTVITYTYTKTLETAGHWEEESTFVEAGSAQDSFEFVSSSITRNGTAVKYGWNETTEGSATYVFTIVFKNISGHGSMDSVSWEGSQAPKAFGVYSYARHYGENTIWLVDSSGNDVNWSTLVDNFTGYGPAENLSITIDSSTLAVSASSSSWTNATVYAYFKTSDIEALYNALNPSQTCYKTFHLLSGSSFNGQALTTADTLAITSTTMILSGTYSYTYSSTQPITADQWPNFIIKNTARGVGCYATDIYPESSASKVGATDNPFALVSAKKLYGTEDIECGVFKYKHEDTVLEVGQAIDFHRTGDTGDYTARLHADGVNQLSIYVNQTRVGYINTKGIYGAVFN